MRLAGQDGSVVELAPVRYQFPGDTHPDDANWLVIRGAVRTPAGSWSFTDPCLLTDEARRLGAWLRDAAAGGIPQQPDPLADDDLWEPHLVFLEPNVALSLLDHSGERVRVRVHFSLEASPPWIEGERRFELYNYVVDLDTTREALLKAAAEWEGENAALPAR